MQKNKLENGLSLTKDNNHVIASTRELICVLVVIFHPHCLVVVVQ